MPFQSLRCHLVSGTKSFICSVSLTNLPVWFEVPPANLKSHVYVFLITRPLAQHKNKNNILETWL